MFVSKKKYNELKEDYDCIAHVLSGKDHLIDIKTNQILSLQKELDKQIPEGCRLTEDELSTLIAVDLLRILKKEGAYNHLEALDNLFEVFNG